MDRFALIALTCPFKSCMGPVRACLLGDWGLHVYPIWNQMLACMLIEPIVGSAD